MKLFKNTVAMIFGSGLTIFLDYLLIFLFIRFLKENEYVLYRQFFLIISTITPFFIGGTPISLGYFLAKSNFNDKKVYLKNTLFILFFKSFIGFTLVILFSNQISSFYNNSSLNQVIIYIAVTIAVTVFSSYYPFYLIDQGKARKLVLVKLFFELIKVSFAILVVVYNMGIENYLKFYIFVSIFKLLFLLWDTHKGQHILKFKVYKMQFVDQIKYGYGIFLSQLVHSVSLVLDKNIVSNQLDNNSFINYTTGVFINPLIPLISSSINSVFYPEYTKKFAKGHLVEVLELWKKSVILTSIVVIPFSFAFIIYADTIIKFLFTSRFLVSTFVFQITQLSSLTSITYFGTLYNAADSTKKFVDRSVVNFFVSIILIFSVSLTKDINLIVIAVALSKFIGFLNNIHGLSEVYHCNYLTVFPFKRILLMIVTSSIISFIFIGIRTLFSGLIIDTIMMAALVSLILFFLILQNKEATELFRYRSLKDV